MELEREGERAASVPAVLRQQGATRSEVGQRRGVGVSILGTLARDQVELGQLLALVLRRDQRDTAVELIDDLVDDLLAFILWRVRREQSADSQVRIGAQWFRDQRVRSLLDSVVHKTVGALQALDQLQANRLPQLRVDLLVGRSAHERERRSVGAAAEAGELLQRLLRPRRQAGQLPHHQVRDVGRVPLRVDALEVP